MCKPFFFLLLDSFLESSLLSALFVDDCAELGLLPEGVDKACAAFAGGSPGVVGARELAFALTAEAEFSVLTSCSPPPVAAVGGAVGSEVIEEGAAVD